MIRKLQLTLYSLCLLGTITSLSLAAPQTPIQTETKDFALWPVSKEGQVPPQLMVQMDVHAYKDKPSYRAFLGDEFKGTPEGALARYTEMLRQPKADVEAAIRLYEKEEYQNARSRDEIRSSVELHQKNVRAMRDLKFNARYDVGNYTLLFSEYQAPDEKLYPLGVFYLHKSDGAYRFTEKVGSAVNLFYFIGHYIYDYGINGNWNSAPRPDYEYSARVPSPFPADPANVHPLTVFFNGTASFVLLDSEWQPTDKIGQFFQQVVQTYRTGSREEWLSLRTPKSKDFWSGSTKAVVDTYNQERDKFNGDQVHWVFTIDFGPSAAVFFVNPNNTTVSKGEPLFIDHLIIWKGEGDYKLTQGEKLPSGEQTFSGNVDSFLDSEPFQDALRGIIKKAYPEAKLQSPE